MTTRKTKKPPENPPPARLEFAAAAKAWAAAKHAATPCIHLRGYFNADRAYQAVKQTDPMSQRVHAPGTPEYRALCKEWNPRFDAAYDARREASENVACCGCDQCAVLAEAWT